MTIIEYQQVEHGRSSKCSAEDKRKRNILCNLDLRDEGRDPSISEEEEEIENSFKSELRSLKG